MFKQGKLDFSVSKSAPKFNLIPGAHKPITPGLEMFFFHVTNSNKLNEQGV
jgi:hypothetical protein